MPYVNIVLISYAELEKSQKQRGVKFRFYAEISAANEQWGEELEFSYCEMEWDLCLDFFFFFLLQKHVYY